MGSGQNGSIKKRVVLVRVKTGSGQNGFGSERVRVGTGFGSERVSGRVGLVKNMFFLKRLYIKSQFCWVKTGPGWFGLRMGSGRDGFGSKKWASSGNTGAVVEEGRQRLALELRKLSKFITLKYFKFHFLF
ncbi:hypothetical protein HanIR_Chr12g0579941 [Helianthus annuus]|nr:hypothetical protein HanIR_Chr12g0579941 [Helianthus annuus]